MKTNQLADIIDVMQSADLTLEDTLCAQDLWVAEKFPETLPKRYTKAEMQELYDALYQAAKELEASLGHVADAGFKLRMTGELPYA